MNKDSSNTPFPLFPLFKMSSAFLRVLCVLCGEKIRPILE